MAQLVPEDSAIVSALETFCSNAIRAKLTRKETKNYFKICDELACKDGVILERWFRALLKSVNLLTMNGEVKDLVNVIFKFGFGFEVKVVETYNTFLVSLVSANIDFLGPALKILAQNLLFQEVSNAEEVYTSIHNCLFLIMRTVPSSLTSLYHILVELYPHKAHAIVSIKVYLKNILRISEYAPELRDRILLLIVDRLIQIDVEIHDISNAEMMNKFDAMIQLLLEYIDILRSNTELCDQVFDSIMRAFEHSVLTTHQCKFTQFLIFYLCSFNHVYAELFMKRLMEKSVDGNNSTIKQCSAQYLASFVVRASFLRLASRLMFFEVMMAWLLSYIDAIESQFDLDGDVESHAQFYSISQAVLCVICYRPDTFADIIANRSERTLADYNLDRLVYSNFNPLRYCCSSVVEQFVTVSKLMGWLDCEEIISRNKKLSLIGSDLFQQLMNYFPFDCEFQLPILSSYVNSVYQTDTTPDLMFLNRNHHEERHSAPILTPSTQPMSMSFTDSNMSRFALTPSFNPMSYSHSPILATMSLGAPQPFNSRFSVPSISLVGSQNENRATSMVPINKKLDSMEDNMIVSMNSLSLDNKLDTRLIVPAISSSKKKKKSKSKSSKQIDSTEETIFELQ